MSTSAPGQFLRPLGAFERTIDLYTERNPVQFSLVAELSRPFSPEDVAEALVSVQRRHPLLGVSIGHGAAQPLFRVAHGAIPLVVVPDGTPWQSVVAAEQTRPIPPTPGPLVRAVLAPSAAGALVVLTFAHQIADGVGGLRALLDLVECLDGTHLGPGAAPEAQETLLARLSLPGEGADGPAAAPTDEPMSPPGELVPFTGRAPHVDSLALDPDLTAALRRRSRLESTSVHAALCAAASSVLGRRGRPFVTVLSPLDLRRAVGLADEVVVRFAGTRTGAPTGAGPGLWQRAREASASLSRARSVQTLAAGSRLLAENAPTTCSDAETMMRHATAADIQITNLGLVEAGDPIAAVWGPAQITQMRGEHVLGVLTTGGRLRMVECTHEPVPVLLADIAAVLAEACS